ncbi:hypothetical protein [Methylophaga sp. OBS4]|uniref:hypothetical protein n=1 Tax=Methylophaga sp. OBS4 TaxID=2991935 RepID=UPI0022510061|nr:hypothetical protein [Methylophaga sp. OBS4]MCX4186751.1 hypothetical protein [Methylophaga sp. OBS4]
MARYDLTQPYNLLNNLTGNPNNHATDDTNTITADTTANARNASTNNTHTKGAAPLTPIQSKLRFMRARRLDINPRLLYLLQHIHLMICVQRARRSHLRKTHHENNRQEQNQANKASPTKHHTTLITSTSLCTRNTCRALSA